MVNQLKDFAKPFSEMAESTEAVTSFTQLAQDLIGPKGLFGGAAQIDMQTFNEDSALGKQL